MPPKAKFTRDIIIQAGLSIVRENGIEALTARALGAKLGSSARPIFTVFQSMDEVQAEVKESAKSIYDEYVRKGLEQELAFKGVGTQYIVFAMQEPKLFQLLFMSEQEQPPKVVNVMPIIDDNYEDILLSVQNGYHLSKSTAEQLYRHLWIYTHGIAVLCATNMCIFTPEEINKMISQVFKGVLKEIIQENGIGDNYE
ncbi:TetR/AcrR family transcriptional regulator [Lachnospiraceae bacterium WCA-9-b2]|uniref:TetR/AcrR family transcriptional regulator n=1 Tax=Sporofaciens musculi TaxID=2681861 RepID=A0A7X3MDG6_9FIRM|nr:TetR/AcrR family transcriptional regulator [Sporofaciens musculi]MXP74388.1 TetR/AcrR family transcriptional regulator [Sporofaciens musculi]